MRPRNRRSRALFGLLLIAAGLILWLLLSPDIIALGGEKGTFISFLSWLGFGVCILGVGIVIYGIGYLLSI